LTGVRTETDSSARLKSPLTNSGAQTQRSLEYFSIGSELMPRQMIPAYAILKKTLSRSAALTCRTQRR
jgi:fumarate hydratase, class II